MQNIKADLSQRLITAGTEEIYFAKGEMSNGINAIYNQIWLPHSISSGLSNYRAFLEKCLLNDVPLNFILNIVGTAQQPYCLILQFIFFSVKYIQYLISKIIVIMTFLSSPDFYTHITM